MILGRLEDIKLANYSVFLEILSTSTVFDGNVIKNDFDFLIEQAEKAEKYSAADDYDLDMIIELQNKVERYEEALKEIAKYEDDDDVRRFALFAQRTLEGKS